MKEVEKTKYQILDEIEETWEEVKSDHRLEMNPKAIDWLIEEVSRLHKLEKQIKAYEEEIDVDNVAKQRDAAYEASGYFNKDE